MPHILVPLRLGRALRSLSIAWQLRFVSRPSSVIGVPNRRFTKVGLSGLCDIALKDIQSKLDANNIVQELFSPFTAKSVIPRLSTVYYTNITPAQPQVYQRNGTRALPD